MIEFLVGLFIGAAAGIFVAALCVAARRGDDERTIARRGYLLDQARNSLNRYGELHHLTATITRELDDEGGA